MIQDMHIVVCFFKATTKIMTHVLHITILTMRKPLQANFHSMQVYVDVEERTWIYMDIHGTSDNKTQILISRSVTVTATETETITVASLN